MAQKELSEREWASNPERGAKLTELLHGCLVGFLVGWGKTCLTDEMIAPTVRCPFRLWVQECLRELLRFRRWHGAG